MQCLPYTRHGLQHCAFPMMSDQVFEADGKEHD